MRPSSYGLIANWQAIGHMWPRYIYNVVLIVFKIKDILHKNIWKLWFSVKKNFQNCGNNQLQQELPHLQWFSLSRSQNPHLPPSHVSPTRMLHSFISPVRALHTLEMQVQESFKGKEPGSKKKKKKASPSLALQPSASCEFSGPAALK